MSTRPRAIGQIKVKRRHADRNFFSHDCRGDPRDLSCVALQGARSFPWFALAGVGVAVFVFGFFFLLYSIIFGALEWSSKISKSKRG